MYIIRFPSQTQWHFKIFCPITTPFILSLAKIYFSVSQQLKKRYDNMIMTLLLILIH